MPMADARRGEGRARQLVAELLELLSLVGLLLFAAGLWLVKTHLLHRSWRAMMYARLPCIGAAKKLAKLPEGDRR